jgi:cytochrome c5
MKLLNIALAATAALTIGSTLASYNAHADDSKPVAEVKEAGRDVKKMAKKVGRSVKDATCPMIHGKADCTVRKAGHKIENAADEVGDKMVEPKK